MATDTGTVELPPETTETDDSLVEAMEALLNAPESPQKPTEQVPPATEEQPPQETEPTPETEPEVPPAAEDAPPETDDGLPPDVQERINKRMNQLTAKFREAEEAKAAAESEIESLKAKVKELAEATQEPQAALPPDADPVLRVPEINKLWQDEQKYDDARREVTALLREYEDDPDGVLGKLQQRMPKQGFSTTRQVKLFLEDLKDDALMRVNHLRSQRENASSRYVQKMEKEAEKFHDQAVKAYPEVLDKNSAMGKRVAEIAKTMPALFNPRIIPNGWQIATDLAAGQLAREAKGAAPVAPKTPPPKLSTPAKAPVAPRVNGKPAASVLRQKARETGSRDDVVRLMESLDLTA